MVNQGSNIFKYPHVIYSHFYRKSVVTLNETFCIFLQLGRDLLSILVALLAAYIFLLSEYIRAIDTTGGVWGMHFIGIGPESAGAQGN